MRQSSKSLLLYYPHNTQDITLKTSFQVNKLARTLLADKGNVSDIFEYDLSKSDKITLNLKDLIAVLSSFDWNSTKWKEPVYHLHMTFLKGSQFTLPIVGEKRARNAYYNLSQWMKDRPDGEFHKILQSQKKDFSLIKFFEPLQFVKLREPVIGLSNISENGVRQ